MKQSGVKIGKKALSTGRQRKTAQRIRMARGKYKHLDLMKGLVEARKEERRADT